MLISFVTLTVLTRYLGTSGYGNFNLVFTYLSFFGVLADLGVNLLFVREYSKKNDPKLVTHFFVSKLLLILFSLFFALVFVPFLPYDPTVKLSLVIGAFAVSLGYLNGFGYSVLQSKVKLNQVALYEVVNRVITVAFMLLFIYMNLGFVFVIASVLLGNLASVLISMAFIEDFIPKRISFSKSQVKDSIVTAIPIGITAVFSALYFRLDTLLLSFYRSPEDVGIYSLAYKLFENILVLWGLYMASVYPLASRYYHENNKRQFKSLIRTTVLMVMIASGLVILVGYLWGLPLISLVAGDKFELSFPVLKILLLAVPFFLLNNIFYHILLVADKVKLIIYSMVFSLVLNLILNLLLIPQFGYKGAGFTTLMTEIILVLIYLAFLRKQKIL